MPRSEIVRALGFASLALLLPALVLPALLVVATPRAAAADEGAADEGGDVVVLLVPHGQEGYVEAGLDAFRAQLADLPVRLRIEPVGRLQSRLGDQLTVARDALTRTSASAVFWFDFVSPEETLLMMTAPPGNRATVRRLDRAADSGTGGGAGAPLEAAALIARSQLTAQLGIGPEPPRSGPELPRPVVTVDAGYAVDAFGDGAPVLHGVLLRVTARPVAWLALALGARVGPGSVVTGDVVDLALDRWPLSLEVGWSGRLAPRWRLEATAGLALEALRARHHALPLGWSADFDGTSLRYGAAATLTVSVRALPRLHVALVLGADALFPHDPLTLHRAAERETLLDPWPVRPRGALVLAFDLP